jgi:hypothetical protein
MWGNTGFSRELNAEAVEPAYEVGWDMTKSLIRVL